MNHPMEGNMDKQVLSMASLSLLFSVFLMVYLLVWLSGYFDDSQYVDTYRVLVSAGVGFTFYELKRVEKGL